MSLRLTKPGLTPADEFIAAHRRIIGYTKRGPVWAVAGGAPEDGDTDTGDGGDGGGDDDADESEEDEDDDEGEGDDDAKGKGKKDDEEPTVPQWKYDKLHKRMTAADQRSSALQKQIDELKSGKDVNAEVKAELDALKANVSKIEADRDKHQQRANGLTIKLAAVSLPGAPEWENLETALKMADLSDVDVDEDTGKVDKRALKSALTALAKEHPYLVKKKAAAGDSTDQDGTVSGSKMNGTRKGTKGTTDRDALKARFPVLR